MCKFKNCVNSSVSDSNIADEPSISDEQSLLSWTAVDVSTTLLMSKASTAGTTSNRLLVHLQPTVDWTMFSSYGSVTFTSSPRHHGNTTTSPWQHHHNTSVSPQPPW